MATVSNTDIHTALIQQYVLSATPVRVSELAKSLGTSSKRINQYADDNATMVELTDVEVSSYSFDRGTSYRLSPALQLSRRYLCSLIKEKANEQV